MTGPRWEDRDGIHDDCGEISRPATRGLNPAPPPNYACRVESTPPTACPLALPANMAQTLPSASTTRGRPPCPRHSPSWPASALSGRHAPFRVFTRIGCRSREFHGQSRATFVVITGRRNALKTVRASNAALWLVAPMLAFMVADQSKCPRSLGLLESRYMGTYHIS